MRETLEALAAILIIVLQVINIILGKQIDSRVTEQAIVLRTVRESIHARDTGSDVK